MKAFPGAPGRRDIFVIGGSAGAIEPLLTIVRSLPADLAAAVFVVVHGGSSNTLASLLDRVGPLPAAMAEDHEPITPGKIYVAAHDYHLLVKPGIVRVTRGPKENGFRPAVDPLFRTAARAYGSRVVGVILSGALDDGAHGMSLVKKFGGKAIVQDPAEASSPSMPKSACRSSKIDYVVPSAEIGALLTRLSEESPSELLQNGGAVMDPDDQLEPDIAEEGSEALAHPVYTGGPSTFTCPECGGCLWELDKQEPVRYRCHVGHGFTADVLLSQQGHNLEIILWAAVRALDENAALSRRMAKRAKEGDLVGLEQAYLGRGVTAQQQANVIRELLVSHQPNSLELGPSGERPSVSRKPHRKRAEGN